MPVIQATIVHDMFGRIMSINRPAKGANVVVVPQDGQSTFVTDIDSEGIDSLLQTHMVDVGKKALVRVKNAGAAG